ncbi:MAG: hypothetical protein R3F56_06825 [Planctomycetota bacterium]
MRRAVQQQRQRPPQPAPEPPKPRSNQIFWTRLGLVVCMGGALVFSIGALLSQPHIVRLRSFDPIVIGKAKVKAAADALAAAWCPADKAALATRLSTNEDMARFRLALRESLRDSVRQKDATAQARLIACAEVVGGDEVRAQVANIATGGGGGGGGGAQVAAIGVAHRLAPWSRAELGDFLGNDDARVRIGTLDTVARSGGELPPQALVACLVSEDRLEREAALRAVPHIPSVELRDELERMLIHGDGRATSMAILALARCSCNEEYEEQVLHCLGTRTDDVKRAALTFLGQLGRAPARTDRVWSVVVDTMQSPDVRELAMLCLEQTNSVDIEALRAHAPMMTPAERLLAARCLIRARDPMALTVLTGLLERPSAPEVKESCRRHLAWLTGAPATATVEQFQEAFERNGRRVRASHLPPLGFEVGAAGQT